MGGDTAEAGVERVRQAPLDDVATEPVEHGHQVHEPAPHRDIGDVGIPDLATVLDGEAAQPIRVDRMLRKRSTGVRPRHDRLQGHQSH